MLSAPPDPSAAHDGADAEDLALRARMRGHATRDPRGDAARTGLLRRGGRGQIAGVCAALAEAGGLPERLVRIVAIGLMLLGIGLPFYVILALVLPRELPSEGQHPAEVDRPILAIRRLRPQRGDLVLLLAVIPAAVIAVIWTSFMATTSPSPLILLIPLVLAGLMVLALAAARARRARTAYLFAQLGHRAGIVDAEELAGTIAELRREAPRAWADPDAQRVRSGRSARATRRASGLAPARLGRRATLAALGSTVAIGTAAFMAISWQPGLAPGLGSTSNLPGIGRAAAAAGVATALAGALLLVLGFRRRRSVLVALAGGIALLLFGGGVTWVRLTDSTDAAPITVAIQDYQVGPIDVCEGLGPETWHRPIVIDLSGLSTEGPTPEQQAEYTEQWRADNPGLPDENATLTMWISCDRTIGDITVKLPGTPGELPVSAAVYPELGEIVGPEPTGQTALSMSGAAVVITGSTRSGNVHYITGGS